MNSNSGNDPMLCSFISDDWGKFVTTTNSTSFSMLPALSVSTTSPNAFTLSVEGLISPEPNPSFNDLASLWSNERKRVDSIKIEDCDSLSAVSPSSNPSEVDMEDIDVGSNTTITEVKSEVDDFDDMNVGDSMDGYDYEEPIQLTNTFQMTEAEARKFVEEQFERIASIPSSSLTHREKIKYILSQSDCKDYTVDDILNFDKKCGSSARACAKIVQDIPQRYRWECVKPEDIPCCYTIVADCKKVSSRDKPPRPMNAFMIWAQGSRRLINELCPKMQNALISEALGYFWRQKSDAFKNKFEQEKLKLRRFHNIEFPEYKYKPKTKVQKAKEKQELSLSKAKMRASLKREKLQQMEESSLYKRRVAVKSGRPRKMKPITEKKVEGKPLPSNISNSCLPVKMSPTKPAIKDMLTLKILNDRRSKAVSSDAICHISTPSETVVTSHGQLSPLEMDDNLGDIFDELSSLDALTSETKSFSDDRTAMSSIYDTPANTPPLDFEEEPRLSPCQTLSSHFIHSPSSPLQIVSPSHSPPLSSTSSQPAASSVTRSPSPSSFSPVVSSNPTPAKVLMPSLSAILSSPSKAAPLRRSPLQGVQLPASTTLKKNVPIALLSSFPRHTLQSLPAGCKIILGPIDSNNNRGEIANKNLNCRSDGDSHSSGFVQIPPASNGTITFVSSPPSYATSVKNSKLANTFNENCDLDALNLDLNILPLSDEVMRSLIDTL